MYGYIYKTTCLITKLIYVGQHKAEKFEPNRYIGSGRLFSQEVKKYGKENFVCELIDTAENLDELNSKEDYWVEFYRSRDPLVGYDVKKGGEQLGLTGCCKIKRGEETMVVERASVKPYLDDGWVLTNTKETRNAKSSIKNKKYYQEHKEAILARGKKWREEHKDQMHELQAKWEANRQPTEEYKAKHKARSKRYYLEHKESCLKKLKEKREANLEEARIKAHEYYLANKDKYLARSKKYRAKKKAELD